jgi:hypothetical protein
LSIMKNLSLVAVLMLAGILAFAQNPTVINDPNAQKRSVGDFHGIRVGGGIQLYLSQGGEEAVAVSSNDREYRDRIVTEVKDGILHIYLDDKFHWNWGGRNLKLRAYVSCKQLDQLRAAGGAGIDVDQTITSTKLEVHIAGGGHVRGKFQAGEMTVGISGGGDSHLSGTAGRLAVSVSGGGDFQGYELAADNCEAKVRGGGDIYVTVNTTLSASVSGGGNVRYKGNGTVSESRTVGGGNITRG